MTDLQVGDVLVSTAMCGGRFVEIVTDVDSLGTYGITMHIDSQNKLYSVTSFTSLTAHKLWPTVRLVPVEVAS